MIRLSHLTRFAPCSLLLALVVLLPACRTAPETIAYRGTAAIATTVDTAMQVWGSYVRAGRATPEEVKAVGDYYGIYQRAMATAEAATLAALDTAPDTSTWPKIRAAAAASADNLLEFIYSLIPESRPADLKKFSTP